MRSRNADGSSRRRPRRLGSLPARSGTRSGNTGLPDRAERCASGTHPSAAPPRRGDSVRGSPCGEPARLRFTSLRPPPAATPPDVSVDIHDNVDVFVAPPAIDGRRPADRSSSHTPVILRETGCIGVLARRLLHALP
jgi:hypothetical protein